MSRDHRKLRVFHEAHALVLDVYRQTLSFPREEWYGVRQQLRRAAVSVPTNIVDGCARDGSKEYRNFLNVALGSASEVAYLIDLSGELGFLAPTSTALVDRAQAVVRQLKRLVVEAQSLVAQDETATRVALKAQSPRPKA